MSNAPPWSVRRRPPLRFLCWSALAGLALGAVAAWLVPRLMIEPASWPGPLAGVLLAAATLASVAQGCGARVDADGMLTYLVRGTPMWRVDLRRVEGFAPVRAGMLAGVGVVCRPEDLERLSRKGASPDEGRALGLGAVMEHLTDADLAALEALRRRFALAPAATSATVPT